MCSHWGKSHGEIFIMPCTLKHGTSVFAVQGVVEIGSIYCGFLWVFLSNGFLLGACRIKTAGGIFIVPHLLWQGARFYRFIDRSHLIAFYKQQHWKSIRTSFHRLLIIILLWNHGLFGIQLSMFFKLMSISILYYFLEASWNDRCANFSNVYIYQLSVENWLKGSNLQNFEAECFYGFFCPSHEFFNHITAVTWLKYCRYGVKLYPINQSIQSYHDMITSLLQGLVCSALVDSEQQGFYTWPRLLWQGHFWGLVIYTPVVERLTVPVLWLRSVATGIWTPDLLHARQTLLWTKQQSWPAVIPAIYCSFPLINSNPEPIKWYLYKISEVLYRRKGKLLENARF